MSVIVVTTINKENGEERIYRIDSSQDTTVYDFLNKYDCRYDATKEEVLKDVLQEN